MSKISTYSIKSMIPVWLGAYKIRKSVLDFLFCDINSDEDLKEIAESLKIKATTREKIEHIVISQWTNGMNWSRVKKQKLKDSASDYFLSTGFVNGFCGDNDSKILEKMTKNPELQKECTLRVFVPKRIFSDNFRLEVITDEADEEVVGWVVIAD